MNAIKIIITVVLTGATVVLYAIEEFPLAIDSIGAGSAATISTIAIVRFTLRA